MVEPKVTTNQKEQLYILSVNRHTYEVAREYVDNCINMAREAIKPTSKMAIIAIEKEYKVIMLKETYGDKRKYYKAITKYEDEGFKIYMLGE